jgi:hypothetical protein
LPFAPPVPDCEPPVAVPTWLVTPPVLLPSPVPGDDELFDEQALPRIANAVTIEWTVDVDVINAFFACRSSEQPLQGAIFCAFAFGVATSALRPRVPHHDRRPLLRCRYGSSRFGLDWVRRGSKPQSVPIFRKPDGAVCIASDRCTLQRDRCVGRVANNGVARAARLRHGRGADAWCQSTAARAHFGRGARALRGNGG